MNKNKGDTTVRWSEQEPCIEAGCCNGLDWKSIVNCKESFFVVQEAKAVSAEDIWQGWSAFQNR
jgi:hypothetical protein